MVQLIESGERGAEHVVCVDVWTRINDSALGSLPADIDADMLLINIRNSSVFIFSSL